MTTAQIGKAWGQEDRDPCGEGHEATSGSAEVPGAPGGGDFGLGCRVLRSPGLGLGSRWGVWLASREALSEPGLGTWGGPGTLLQWGGARQGLRWTLGHLMLSRHAGKRPVRSAVLQGHSRLIWAWAFWSASGLSPHSLCTGFAPGSDVASSARGPRPHLACVPGLWRGAGCVCAPCLQGERTAG